MKYIVRIFIINIEVNYYQNLYEVTPFPNYKSFPNPFQIVSSPITMISISIRKKLTTLPESQKWWYFHIIWEFQSTDFIFYLVAPGQPTIHDTKKLLLKDLDLCWGALKHLYQRPLKFTHMPWCPVSILHRKGWHKIISVLYSKHEWKWQNLPTIYKVQNNPLKCY